MMNDNQPGNQLKKHNWKLLGFAFPIIVLIALLIAGKKLEFSEIGILGLVFKVIDDNSPVLTIDETEINQNISFDNTQTSESEMTATPNVKELNTNNSSSIFLPDHYLVNIGTGLFAESYYSDGTQAFDISAHYRIQRIIREEAPNGCSLSNWNSELIWITGKSGNSILLNGEEIGKLIIDTGNHGYLVKVSIKPGDEICLIPATEKDFSVIWGPDTLYHYDSYCFRGGCSTSSFVGAYFCKFGDSAQADSNSFAYFDFSLEENQFINGQCSEFSLNTTKEVGGVAYIIKGPGNYSWSTKHGWWEICTNYSDENVTEKLYWQANSLEMGGNTGAGYAIKLICEAYGEIVTCIKQ